MRERLIFWVDVGHAVTLFLGAAMFIAGRGDKWIEALAVTVFVVALLMWIGGRFALRGYHLFDHLHDIHPRFDLADNRLFFTKGGRHRQYAYLGVSGQTIEQELLRAMRDGVFPSGSTLRFLLADPEGKSLPQYLVHERGRELDAAEMGEELARAVDHIRTTAAAIEGLARQFGVHVEVRFNDTFVGYWAHLTDEDVAVGPLFRGSHGFDTPVLHLRARSLLFKWYREEFERLWVRARRAKASAAKVATA